MSLHVPSLTLSPECNHNIMSPAVKMTGNNLGTSPSSVYKSANQQTSGRVRHRHRMTSGHHVRVLDLKMADQLHILNCNTTAGTPACLIHENVQAARPRGHVSS
ncbi:hypothetical protein J3458_012661 [Metarhizium acridum]|uniref:uncharacterized protein n=1 Tax=Metarhizium acridum TaxID=92637 RepID=UPI001C6AF4F9|nr:hypothetical protein J3458_012661 [Metarhizium acridum]